MEKLFHALSAGTIPLYRGGGTLRKPIPDDCYIDCSNHDPRKMYLPIKTMSHETIVGYRRAAIEFLGSSLADRFTWKYRAHAIIQRLKAQEQH